MTFNVRIGFKRTMRDYRTWPDRQVWLRPSWIFQQAFQLGVINDGKDKSRQTSPKLSWNLNIPALGQSISGILPLNTFRTVTLYCFGSHEWKSCCLNKCQRLETGDSLASISWHIHVVFFSSHIYCLFNLILIALQNSCWHSYISKGRN